MIWHSATLLDVKTQLDSDIDNGLTSVEATIRLQNTGKNQLTETRKKSFFERIIAQLKDVMVLILIAAAAVSFATTFIEKTNDWIEPIIIIAIVILNAFLGVIQESKAEAALEALKNMAAPSAKVIRDGAVQIIDASFLVPGDVIELIAGDFIPADARIISSASLRCDESSLTGESVSAEKNSEGESPDIASIGDRFNMVYSGCAVSYGRGKALVTETGMDTEMGKIATILRGTEDSITPLQIKLASLGKKLGFLALGICGFIFIFGLIEGLGVIEMFLTAISLAVAAIPEGLPAIVTIVLALGVQRMVKKNAIIRRLPAVETLGSASVICSDKTGTLTQNRMTMVKAWCGNDIVDLSTTVNDDVVALLRFGAMCCDGNVVIEDGKEVHIGDPTETGIVAACMRCVHMDKATIDTLYPRMCELPFDSDRKLMTTVNLIDGKPYAVVKGAPDMLLSRCTSGNREGAVAANHNLATEALRVIGVAVKPLAEVPAHPTMEELEYDLSFVGLMGMIDPPRPEAMEAILECKHAGIRTIMITGDHIITASAIAKQLGILDDQLKAITGQQLGEISDEELFNTIEDYAVYARVSPEDKIRIVQAWQSKGHVVAMTGDGVNDAPALKAADIGCAMGITGTDVAKGAAAMTLTDDNFATIVTAVKEGRSIYNNIKKAVHFLLSCNLGEIVAVFFGMLIFAKSPLLPIQLLWINLVTDGLPAIALGMEPPERGVMKHKPRGKNESIFSGGLGINALWQGVMFGVITLIAYYIGNKLGGADYARTMAFATLSISQLFHAFNTRSDESIFKVGLFKNKFMIGAFLISLVLMLGVLLTPVRMIFKLSVIHPNEFYEILLLSIVPIVVCEFVKLCTHFYKKSKKRSQKHGS